VLCAVKLSFNPRVLWFQHFLYFVKIIFFLNLLVAFYKFLEPNRLYIGNGFSVCDTSVVSQLIAQIMTAVF
jgi:hypothetical protein